MTTQNPINLPTGWSYLHDEFNAAPFAERCHLARVWLSLGRPRLAWQILRGKVTASSLPVAPGKVIVVDPDGHIIARSANETAQEKFDRLMAEHNAECDESARTGTPMEFNLAKFEEVKAAFKATQPPCQPRETFPAPFPMGAIHDRQ